MVHKPDVSSTLLVEQGDGIWVLQIRAALTAFEYEVHNKYGNDSYSTAEEFQDLIVKHVKENIHVDFGGTQEVVLLNAKVKLGHESMITFEIIGVPESINTLTVKNSSFGSIPRNQSALMLVKKGFDKNQFTLNSNNGHTSTLKLLDSKFQLVKPENTNQDFPFYYVFGIIGFLTLLLLIKGIHSLKINAMKDPLVDEDLEKRSLVFEKW